MPMFDRFQIALDSTHPAARVVIVAGVLDRAAAEEVLRLVGAQARPAEKGLLSVAHLIVDLAGVTRFEPGGMEALHLRRDVGSEHGLQLHLAGCGGHLLFLPLTVSRLLSAFSTFPTTDIALAQLRPEPGPHTRAGVQRSEPPCNSTRGRESSPETIS